MSEIEIRVADLDWLEDDPRWRSQRLELITALRDAPDIRLDEASDSGKGAAETVIVALGSAGAFTTMIEIFKAWIGTRPNRTIMIKRKNGDSTIEFTVKNISTAEAMKLLERFKE
ncbi:effector-associated constant component EACC1 [Actinoplanes sp. HUAS TT8]|uniref:effector-associated constant component EACC1 n=1 Tax=Actinoplanes sp. HUAS TT8 TaxID=3447453 RepID=UPI003F524642